MEPNIRSLKFNLGISIENVLNFWLKFEPHGTKRQLQKSFVSKSI